MMRVIDFDINKKSEEELTQELILANATFDIKKVLSYKTQSSCSAVSILTPIQSVNCAFYHNKFDILHHAAITDLMLSRIYPNHTRRVFQGIYENYTKDSFFILTSKSSLVAMIDEDDFTLTESQYGDLSILLQKAKESDYGRKSLETNEISRLGVYWGNEFYGLDECDQLLDTLKNKIQKKDPEIQYSFKSYDFSNCKNEMDFVIKAKRYAQYHLNTRNLINSDEGR